MRGVPGTGTDAVDAASPLVLLEGVTRSYPGPPPVEALKPCDLRVGAGEYLAVTGPPGAGKTTLLNLLGLLDAPTSGRYLLAGEEVGGLGERDRAALRCRRVGIVPRRFHLLEERTALGNVALAMLYAGVPRGQRRDRARAALERVGLGDRLHALPAALPAEAWQRVAIARAIATQPCLLLADEPAGNLDSGSADAVLDLLGELHAGGLTVVVATRDPAVAARATRQVPIRDGVLGAPAASRPELAAP